MINKKHIRLKDFWDTNGGLTILAISVTITTLTSLYFGQPQWLAILLGITTYFSAVFFAIRRINKRIDSGEDITKEN